MAPALNLIATPAITLILAIALQVNFATLSETTQTTLLQMPYIVGGLAFVMALMAKQSRDLALAMICIVGYWLVRNYLQAPLNTAPAGQIFGAITVALPLMLIALTIIPEYGLNHRTGYFALGLVPGILLFGTIVMSASDLQPPQPVDAYFLGFWFDTTLATSSGWLFMLALLISILVAILRPQLTENCLIGVVVVTFYLFNWFHLSNVSVATFTCMAGLLVYTQLSNFLNIGYRDELTQIPNRRALRQSSKSLGRIYTLAMVDIDHFKKINDNYGHDFGDQAIKCIASKLRNGVISGKAYRYGGEEFCLLFRGKTADEVAAELAQLHRDIANYSLTLREGNKRPKSSKEGTKQRGASKRNNKAVKITVSVGVSERHESEDFNSVIKTADKALYKAKNKGRNCIVYA